MKKYFPLVAYLLCINFSNIYANQNNNSICDKVGYYYCDSKKECKFKMHANSGKCISIKYLQKGFYYLCIAEGLAYLANMDLDFANSIGINNIKIEKYINPNPFNRVITIYFDTFNIKKDFEEMHFNLELMGDIPFEEKINCTKLQIKITTNN